MLMFITRQGRRLAVVYAIATVLFNIFLCFHALGQTTDVDPKKLTLGIVSPVNQKEIEEYFRDFVRYVARKVAASQLIEGSIIVAPSQSVLAKLLAEGKVDFYMESPYPTYLINNIYGAARLFLRRWKGGMADYYAVIFTRRTSEMRRLEDLRGKIIAFEDPGSTSGHLLPKYFLSRLGFKLSEKSRIEPNVSAGEVGYIFAYSQDKLVDLVLTKQVAAAAFSNDDYATLGKRKKSDIRILAETEKLPRHLVSVRKDLDPALANRLEKILLSMDKDPEGRLILQRTDGTTKFDEFPGGEAAMRQRLLDTFYSPETK
jgi:phosphate/phosphite/phosphonate ABC transporter binding protein